MIVFVLFLQQYCENLDGGIQSKLVRAFPSSGAADTNAGL